MRPPVLLLTARICDQMYPEGAIFLLLNLYISVVYSTLKLRRLTHNQTFRENCFVHHRSLV